MDGHLLESTGIKFRALHDVYYNGAVDFTDEEEIDVYRMFNSDLTITMKCKMHGAHNSIPWALEVRDEKGKNLSKDAHITIGSLISASKHIHGSLGPFLQRYMVFADRDTPLEVVACVWRTLDLKESLV